jgi:hypothetical protein
MARQGVGKQSAGLEPRQEAGRQLWPLHQHTAHSALHCTEHCAVYSPTLIIVGLAWEQDIADVGTLEQVI